MWGKKDSEPPKSAPAPVESGDKHGNSIVVGDHNSPNRKVIIRQSYSGIPDKDFRFKVDDSMVSVIHIEGRGYLSNYVVGNVRPSDYWEKKTLHTVKVPVSILSFSDIVFSIASPITFRASGGDVNATVFGDFRFKHENPRNISSILQSSYAKTETDDGLETVFITAEGLEQIIRTGLQDIVRRPLFRDRVYSSLEDVSESIIGMIRESPFFSERCIESTQLDVRPDRTEFEKLDDAEALHTIDMRKIELDHERAMRLEESRKRLTELELEIEDSKRADLIKAAEAELQKIKLSLDAEHYETDYQDNRKKREMDDQQRREIEMLEAKTDSLIKMTQAAAGVRKNSGNDPDNRIICPNCGKTINSGSKFCSECGFAIPIIKHSNKDIPEEISSLFDRVKKVFSGTEQESNPDETTIVMSPVIRNLPHNFKGTVAATDSITFESSKEYVLRLYHKEDLVASVHFYEEVAFKRESDSNGQKIMFYSDYANYSVHSDILGSSKIQAVTRQPVLIICLGDRFYLCCMKETGYLKIDGVDVGQSEITELDLGKKVSIGSYMSFIVELA